LTSTIAIATSYGELVTLIRSGIVMSPALVAGRVGAQFGSNVDVRKRVALSRPSRNLGDDSAVDRADPAPAGDDLSFLATKAAGDQH
jgi:hypothetical protein